MPVGERRRWKARKNRVYQKSSHSAQLLTFCRNKKKKRSKKMQRVKDLPTEILQVHTSSQATHIPYRSQAIQRKIISQ